MNDPTDPTTHTRPNLLDAVTPDHLRDEADAAIDALLALLPETVAAFDAATAVEDRMGAVPHGLVDDQFDAELPGSVRGRLCDARNLFAKLAEPSQEPSEEVLQWALDRAAGVRDATVGATLGRIDGLLDRHERLTAATEDLVPTATGSSSAARTGGARPSRPDDVRQVLEHAGRALDLHDQLVDFLNSHEALDETDQSNLRDHLDRTGGVIAAMAERLDFHGYRSPRSDWKSKSTPISALQLELLREDAERPALVEVLDEVRITGRAVDQ